jgi:hypothetical protein
MNWILDGNYGFSFTLYGLFIREEVQAYRTKYDARRAPDVVGLRTMQHQLLLLVIAVPLLWSELDLCLMCATYRWRA